jgi:hypothetical protein
MNPSKIFSKFKPVQPSVAVLQQYVTFIFFFHPDFWNAHNLRPKITHYYKDPPLELPYYGEDGNP